MEIASRLPPATAVGLAALTFAGLHVLAGTTPASPADVTRLGAFAGRQLISTFSGILQYVIPAALLIGALASILRRRRNVKLLEDAAADPIGLVNSLSWRDFERLVGASFERTGYTVEHTGGDGADGGVDLVLKKGLETTLVQCKQWRSQKVSVMIIRELYGVMAARGARHGIVVSAGDFTPDAKDFAAGSNINLISGRDLMEILRHRSEASSTNSPATPTCPTCGSRMIKRLARKGPTSGQSFWGCEGYPKCRATLPIERPD